ncbi:uncharacterized protein G2W53_040996 [Senna tora]|uniref:Uncharacterized protein n=1 Tax=Senna tora TaxID=362788 RepID=A0A834SGC9_9FABA|nr:uncharacterized protein G2W53_040996 [Senna tora]
MTSILDKHAMRTRAQIKINKVKALFHIMRMQHEVHCAVTSLDALIACLHKPVDDSSMSQVGARGPSCSFKHIFGAPSGLNVSCKVLLQEGFKVMMITIAEQQVETNKKLENLVVQWEE